MKKRLIVLATLLLLTLLIACAKETQVPTVPVPSAPVQEEVPMETVPKEGSMPVEAGSLPTAKEEAVEEKPTELPKPAFESAAATHTVEIGSSGFSPKTIMIKAGDEVIFVNTESTLHWVASNVHPTHRVYPGSDIRKCETEPKNIFDACHGLQQGEEFSFTFSKKGRWPYHDHLNPSLSGTIVVE